MVGDDYDIENNVQIVIILYHVHHFVILDVIFILFFS